MNLLSKTFTYIISALTQNKVMTKVKGEFSEALNNELLALWNKVKPIFIKEDPLLVDNIEKDPENEIAQGGLKYQLSKHINDQDFISLIAPQLERIESELKKEKKEIKINKVNVSGTENITIVDSTISGNITKVEKNGNKSA